jgi:hypothetical protein
MRTYSICEAVNNPDVEIADYSALASHMQVSVDTMNAVLSCVTLHITNHCKDHMDIRGGHVHWWVHVIHSHDNNALLPSENDVSDN